MPRSVPEWAVINGGANRECNLHPLCEWCEPPKTEADVHEKSRSRRRLRHAGIKLAPKGRPLPGTIASGWKHRMDGGWERRLGGREGSQVRPGVGLSRTGGRMTAVPLERH
jgi:hypothetical protein